MDKNDEEHLTFDTYKEQIDVWYRAHNIIRERVEMYYDFISSLLNLIDETYLGSDVLVSEDDTMKHYLWCINKIIDNFQQERIYFNDKGTQYGYLWILFNNSYYKVNNNEKYTILSDYFKLLFTFNKIKKPTELESFIDLYKIFDQNLKKIN